jgi:hypothetical protein
MLVTRSQNSSSFATFPRTSASMVGEVFRRDHHRRFSRMGTPPTDDLGDVVDHGAFKKILASRPGRVYHCCNGKWH